MRWHILFSLFGLSAASFALACGGGDGDAVAQALEPAAGGSGGGSGGQAGASDAGADASKAGSGGSIHTGGTGGSGGSEGDCSQHTCSDDQHCELIDGQPSCVGNTCNELDCDPTERCETTAQGARCVSNACGNDLDCPEAQHCKAQLCVDDVCQPGERRCEGNTLLECEANGSGESDKYTCASGSPHYQSTCDAASVEPACSCQDDWDCPAHTVCDVNRCTGTGVKPTCSLPPGQFQDMLPTNEITWGGTQQSPVAQDSPFPNSTQVVHTPLVANLDDDNGDGLIDERDFPEIVFATFCNHDYTSNGVLRAIHGGGPNKGKDFFATCGNKVWHEGMALDAVQCTCAQADVDPTAGLAVGDLDYDGVPEIVATLEGGANANSGVIRIYSNTGELLAESESFAHGGANPAPALANIDHEGLVEIVIGRNVLTLGKDTTNNLVFVDRFEGAHQTGANGQGPVPCIADIIAEHAPEQPRDEIIAGPSVYRLPKGPPGATSRADCTGQEQDAEEIAFCNGQLVTIWNGATVNGSAMGANNGFCAVADVLGADTTAPPGPDNPLDGVPEVVVVSNGPLYVFDSQTGTLLRNINLGGQNGGAPNVDDFDGDGFPEIGTAQATAYMVIDLQEPSTECPAWPTVNDDNSTRPRTPPSSPCSSDADCGDTSKFACNEDTGTCVCLHNGWRRRTEDDSSRVTGSSVFDFNGDGAAEVIYNDECNFRIYDGLNGAVLFEEPSESRTRIEYPVVADVDNDGNAEIVFATTTESGFCGADTPAEEQTYNAGIEVWGDANDEWVSARRIWNQHAYHVTNVTEGGQVPLFEPPSWMPLNGRFYNTYRSNPRSFGVAPDLTIDGVQVSSPGQSCGELSTQVNIAVQVSNIGDLRVGPGVVISYRGQWDSISLDEPLKDNTQAPLRSVLQNSLEPGDSLVLTVSYDASYNGQTALPDRVGVTVDDGDNERECNEANNQATKDVQASEPMADLRIELGALSVASCPEPAVPTQVFNDGSAPANNYVVRYFAGNPYAGGTMLHELTRPGPLAPGATDSFDATLTSFPQNLSILVYGVVDPDNAIEECNDGNNIDNAPGKIMCTSVH